MVKIVICVRFCVPCGWVQGLSLPGHLAPQQASAAALEQELYLWLVRVTRRGGRGLRGPGVLVIPGSPGHQPQPGGSRSCQRTYCPFLFFHDGVDHCIDKISLASEENVCC